MTKKCIRYFGGLLGAQEKWLNRMAARGYRLSSVGKLVYTFEPCEAGAYVYGVEFVAPKSRESAEDYARFLKDCGYRVFFKNINLNWNVGKVVVRPWADRGGRLATNRTTFNRELLIVEKAHDGKPFALHTTIEDKMDYTLQLCKPAVYLLIVSAILGIALSSWVPSAILAVLALVCLVPILMEWVRLRRLARIQE